MLAMTRPTRWLAAAALLACKFSAEGIGGDGGASVDEAESTAAESTAPTGESGDSGDSGEATATTAPPANCGDGVRDPDEACDDGPGNGADQACTPVCTVNSCGDGFQRAGVEACDDGDDDDDDGCVGCVAAVCGDGFVYKNVESCDGMGESADCDADCSLVQCGDEVSNPAAGETCDLGPANGVYGGLCNATCNGPGPSCGDGVVDTSDEVCDGGMPQPPHRLCNQCKVIACEKGWSDCDGVADNGCEIDLNNDDDHCGSCEMSCGIFNCSNGNCGF